MIRPTALFLAYATISALSVVACSSSSPGSDASVDDSGQMRLDSSNDANRDGSSSACTPACSTPTVVSSGCVFPTSCETTGVETVSTTSHPCVNGTCGSSTSMQMRSCTREESALPESCRTCLGERPGNEMSAFGECTFANACTTNGSRTATLRTYSCSGTSWIPSQQTITEDCTRPEPSTCSVRTWSGATASVRLIDTSNLSNQTENLLCVYGTDSDQPYGFIVSTGTSPNTVTNVAANYIRVPAGIPLRTSTHRNFTGSVGLDDCDASSAIAGIPTLESNRFYTAVNLNYDEFFTGECASSTEESYCSFYPRHSSGSSSTEVECASEQVYWLSDGFRDGATQYLPGLRIVNATSNAAMLGASESVGASTSVRHISMLTEGGAGNYAPLENWNRIAICPKYLSCLSGLTSMQESNATFCFGQSALDLIEAESERFRTTGLATTVYVFGDVGQYNNARSEVIASQVSVIVAADISDGSVR